MPIPTDSARFLAEAARAAPSADNSQPLDFSWDGREFVVSYSHARGTDKLYGPQSHLTLLAVGACLENVDAAMSALGIGGKWKLEETTMASGVPYAKLCIDDAACVPQLPANLPLFNRHANRFPYKKSPIPAELTGRVEGLTRASARLIVLQSDRQKTALAGHARIAAEARFCTREIHEWLTDSLRFTPAESGSGHGLDVRTLRLPPGGSMFLRFIEDWNRLAWLNRFGLFKVMAITETMLLRDAPELICIVGGMEPASVIDAGRLLSRVWTDLNAMGLAVHPYYVITDQLLRLQSAQVPAAMIERVEQIRTGLPRLLGTAFDESLHIILRIGFPRVHPRRAQRLPLETVYKDLTSA